MWIVINPFARFWKMLYSNCPLTRIWQLESAFVKSRIYHAPDPTKIRSLNGNRLLHAAVRLLRSLCRRRLCAVLSSLLSQKRQPWYKAETSGYYTLDQEPLKIVYSNNFYISLIKAGWQNRKYNTNNEEILSDCNSAYSNKDAMEKQISEINNVKPQNTRWSVWF